MKRKSTVLLAASCTLLAACSTTIPGETGSVGYKLSGAQSAAVKSVMTDFVYGSGPLRITKLRARKVMLSGGKSMIELCGVATKGQKTLIGMQIEQGFYGTFNSVRSSEFGVQVPTSDGGGLAMMSKCAARGLST